MGACVSKNPTGSKENTGSGKNEAALKTVSERIPLDKTPEGKKKRIDLFKQFDTDGDGKLSHDDLHRGCRDVLKLGEVTNRLPDITKRAYNRACGLATRVKGVGCDESVEFNEFRYFLSLVRDYFDLTVMFDGIDTSGNMLVEYAEFLQAVPKLNKWGAKIEDPDAAFKSIDGNGSGVVTFDEFAIWASSNRLELSGDKGESPDNNDSNACRDGASTTHEKMEALKTVSERIPLDKTPEGKKKRIDLFKQFDTDGDGKLSHDDLHRGCRDVLKLGEVTNRLPDITKRAYNRACGLATRVKGVGCDESVEFNEFRYFLSLVRDYFDLTVMFDGIDTSGNMLVEYAEFLQAVPKLNEWGAKIEDPDAAFKSIDGNGSGVVTFDEFAIWASSNRLDLRSPDASRSDIIQPA
uniref:Putative flagellar calcium-binding protein n=1 Tax=Trypanosoma vivax (strain Y486) TaxID=1055687 RepID=G0U1D8_TRYVY|nr:putative flagellar calcium-binding protein [Trypanosoma vivax Y486]